MSRFGKFLLTFVVALFAGFAVPALAAETNADPAPMSSEKPAATPDDARHDWWSKAMSEENEQGEACSSATYSCCCKMGGTATCTTPQECSDNGGSCVPRWQGCN